MYKFLRYRVRDAMTSSPITTTPDTPLRELENIFEIHDFNVIPVLHGPERLVGVVTKYDLLKAFIFTAEAMMPRYGLIMERPAKSIMTTEPVTVSPDLPLSRLVQKLVEIQTKSFPVVENERLLGIISREDVLQALRCATED